MDHLIFPKVSYVKHIDCKYIYIYNYGIDTLHVATKPIQDMMQSYHAIKIRVKPVRLKLLSWQIL